MLYKGQAVLAFLLASTSSLITTTTNKHLQSSISTTYYKHTLIHYIHLHNNRNHV